VQFSEAELTAAVTGAAKATLAAQDKEIRKGRADVEQVWHDLGGYGRYQLIEPIGSQVLPILLALPDVPRVVGERPSYTGGEIRKVVEQHTADDGSGRIRRAALIVARAALVASALASIPPWTDPDEFVVPDSL